MSVYVIGHKSPDTDSVTSAIAYAELMKAKGEDYVAAVAGGLNPESEMVLKQFGFATPEILTDATGKQLALVDHSDLAQAPDNLSAGEVVAVVDHHKIGDVTTNQPIFLLCHACWLYRYRSQNPLRYGRHCRSDPKVAGLMMACYPQRYRKLQIPDLHRG